MRDRIDGVPVIRLPMLPRPNSGFVDRIVDQGSFAFSALASIAEVRAADVLLVESPPLFLGASAIVLQRLTGVPFVFHVADPWPDFPIAIGALRGRVSIGLARWLEALIYREAALITTVTEPLVDRLNRKPGAAGKVRLLLNSVELDRFLPQMVPSVARARLGWPNIPTVVYVGTVGLAQGLGTLVDAVALMPAGDDMRVVVCGDGLEAADLSARARSMGLERLEFLPSESADRVPLMLAAADAVLVLLRAGALHDESLPTKLVEGVASGRPILMSGGGYAASLIRSAGAGVVADAEDATGLAAALMRASSGSLQPMAEASRALADRFDRRHAAITLKRLLEEAAAQRRGPRTNHV